MTIRFATTLHDHFPPDSAHRRRRRRPSVSRRGARHRLDEARHAGAGQSTDSRALRYSGLLTRDMIDVVPSETVRGCSPWSLARTGAVLAAGTAVALNLMRRLKPKAVVGFGGYPTLPPLLAARLSGIPFRGSRFQRGAGPRQSLLVGPRQRDCDLAAGRARSETRHWRRRRRPRARRCALRSLPPRRKNSLRRSRTVRCACWWSAAAKARG